MNRGQLFIITGINGVGKQTASLKLQKALRQLGQTVERYYGPHVRRSAQRVYDSILTDTGRYHEPYAAALAFFSIHAEVTPEIAKILDQGTSIILDRGPESTWVYQVVEQRLETHNELRAIYDHIMSQLSPTRILLLDAPVGVALERAKQQTESDHIQKQAVHRHERRRQAYLHLAHHDPRWTIIDAVPSIDRVTSQMVAAVTGQPPNPPLALSSNNHYNPRQENP